MATVNIPNGFLGNLTSDQEWKLQQLWMVLLKALEASSGAESSTSQRKSSISRTETNGSARASISSTRVDSSQLSESLKDLGLDATQIRTITQSLTNLNTEELHRGFLASIKNENPDVLMLRFLRARKWDVGNAFAMMIGSVEWRIKEMNVDDVLAKGDLHALKKSKDGKTPAEKKDGTMFLTQSRIGKAFVRGTDKIGRPIVVVQVRIHKPGEQSEEVLNEFIVHVIEAVRLLLRPPVETATILFDMTGFSLSNMEYPPVKFIIRCFEANYPESLGLMLIHNAPWIFSGIWKLIKGWMDPVIVSKVQFTRSANDLKEFIPQENILKPMGGMDDFDYKYIEPAEDENKRMEDTAARDALVEERNKIVGEILTATSSWISATKAKNEDDAKTQKSRRVELADQLSVNYWKLDPYVRSRCHLDRAGIIKEGGKLSFYPERQEVSEEKGLGVEQHENVPATAAVSA